MFEGRPATTRGRWINPLVFAEFALLGRMPQLRRVERPVFILGTGRSGTTILGVVLSMHRQVGFLNEPKALWHAIHPREDIIGSYSHQPGLYRLGAEDAGPDVIRRAHRLYGAYLALTGSRRVVDKYPELMFRVPFVRAIFPDARFLVLARNGRDTVGSIAEWSRRHGSEQNGRTLDWWGVDGRKWRLLREQLVANDPAFDRLGDTVSGFSRQTDMAAVEWIVTMREVIRQRDQLGDDMRVVKFEDLVTDPRTVLREIAGFACLEHDDVYLDYGASVLREGRSRAAPELNPRLQPLFEQTMREMGY
jgi:hypothetical protein